MIVETLCEKYNINKGEITDAYDGLDHTRMAMYRYSYFSSRSNHFDMLSAIKSKIQNSPIQCKWRHAKGQQDEHFAPLNIWASLNV